MNYFTTLAMPLVIAACLIMGFILKKWVSDVDNKYIPTILAVFGVDSVINISGIMYAAL